MNADIYRWEGSRASDPESDWFSTYKGVFSQKGPAFLGLTPAHFIWPGASALVSLSRCRRAALIRAPRPLRGRLLDHIGLRFVLGGAMSIGDGERPKVADAGDGLLIDLGQPLCVEYVAEDGDTTEVTLWIPRAQATSARNNLRALHGQIFRRGNPGVSVLNAAVRALHAELDHLAPSDVDQIVFGLWGMAARLLPTVTTPAPPPAELESFATICRYIETHLAARDLGVERLTRTFGVSRASLYRLFEPVGGVASYVRSRRLGRAREELSVAGRDNRRIGPIAYQSGFSSVTAFNRAFREAYGQTPSEARQNRFNSASVTAVSDANIGILGRSLLAIAQ